RERMLAQPTLGQVSDRIAGRFLHGAEFSRKRFHKAIIGAKSSKNLLAEVEPDSLLIIPGDRTDAIAAILERSLQADGGPFCGVVLSDGLPYDEALLPLITSARVPVIASRQHSYVIASNIHSMTVKTMPGDTEKIERIQGLVSQYVNIP